MKKAKNKKFREKREKKGAQFFLPLETKKYIFGLVAFLLAIIVALSFFGKAGQAGNVLIKGLSFLIGKAVFLLPLILVLAGLVFLTSYYQKFLAGAIIAIFLLILGISGILTTIYQKEMIVKTAGWPDYLRGFAQSQEITKSGGWLGYFVAFPLLKLFDFLVTLIIFTSLIIFSTLVFWYLLRQPATTLPTTGLEKAPAKPSLIKRIFAPKFKVKEIEPQIKEIPRPEPKIPELKTKEVLELQPKARLSEYQPPSLDLLETEKGGPSAGDIRMNSAIIKKTLQNFDIPVEMSEINIGPTVTQYTLKPAEGVKLSKITALSNDLALALASHPIRIEAPIPGKSLVGIEVPNKIRARVRLRDLIENQEFQNSSSNLLIVLGRDVSGSPVYADLAKMPHLLVSGSTGTGKTIFLNSLILSLLYRPPTNLNPYGGSPEILKFILIDPKRLEFSIYNELPHLLGPVIFDPQKAVNALKWLILEMERRFDLLSEAKARDIASYNEMVRKEGTLDPLPYIVLIIDELADLMAAKGREIEAGIVRLAQMARAVGIHLVVATQRPSVEVITGLIKANITSRITFQVASQVDSRTILDMAGAEKLLGLGDMLYLSAEIVKPKRIQASYISEKEVKKVVNYLKSKIPSPSLTGLDLSQPSLTEEDLEEKESPLQFGQEDPLYEEAKRVVIEAKKASASLLQRRLRIGYARAARLIDILEERGVVGPGEGAKPRQVYLPSSQENRDENNHWQKI